MSEKQVKHIRFFQEQVSKADYIQLLKGLSQDETYRLIFDMGILSLNFDENLRDIFEIEVILANKMVDFYRIFDEKPLFLDSNWSKMRKFSCFLGDFDWFLCEFNHKLYKKKSEAVLLKFNEIIEFVSKNDNGFIIELKPRLTHIYKNKSYKALLLNCVKKRAVLTPAMRATIEGNTNNIITIKEEEEYIKSGKMRKGV